MKIFPAIDIYDGKAVRLYKGDYAEMTVYSEHPEEIALDFKKRAQNRYTWSISRVQRPAKHLILTSYVR